FWLKKKNIPAFFLKKKMSRRSNCVRMLLICWSIGVIFLFDRRSIDVECSNIDSIDQSTSSSSANQHLPSSSSSSSSSSSLVATPVKTNEDDDRSSMTSSTTTKAIVVDEGQQLLIADHRSYDNYIYPYAASFSVSGKIVLINRMPNGLGFCT